MDILNQNKLLEVKELKTYFHTESGIARAVDGVSFDLLEGEVLGIVGESGSGKTAACLSLLKLLPSPPARIEEGHAFYKGIDLLSLPYEEIRHYRGKHLAMIFQEPMTSLNPILTIKTQMNEVLMTHEALGEKEATARSIAMLESLGIMEAGERIHRYPHHFSGGMRQRVMIGMALLANPEILIADEPTTALDVTIQAQILELLSKIRQKRKKMGMIFITHNLALVSKICDRILVMYAGKVQEKAPVSSFFKTPLHPYSKGLLECLPENTPKGSPLRFIKGQVPDPLSFPKGCRFWPRCPSAMPCCRESEPSLIEKSGSQVRCWLYH